MPPPPKKKKKKKNKNKNNRDLFQGVLHLWSTFSDPSLNGFRVIARTSKWLIHTRTHGHTDTQTQATTIPEAQIWPRVKMMFNNKITHTHKISQETAMGRRYSQSPCSRHIYIVLGEEISIGGLDYMFGSAHSPTCTNWIYMGAN